MTSKLFITRHGIREDWVNPAWKLTAKRVSDTPLSLEGFNLAKELGSHCKLNQESFGIKYIISSPMERCVQTANEVAIKLNLPIYIDYGIIEWAAYGHEQVEPLSLNELMMIYTRIDGSYEPFSAEIPKEELQDQLYERCKNCIQHLVKKFNDPFLIVTHAAPYIALSRGIIGDDQDRLVEIRTGVCSLTQLKKDGAQWVKSDYDCNYLTGKEQNHWFFPNREHCNIIKKE
eukprot:gene1285-1624_t